MNKLLLFIVGCVLTALSASAQDTAYWRNDFKSSEGNDSLAYYRYEAARLRAEHNRLLLEDPTYRNYMQRIQALTASSDAFYGIMIFGTASLINTDKLNSDLASEGLPQIEGPVYGIGYGLTFKKNRGIFDFSAAFGTTKSSVAGDQKFSVDFSTALMFTYGYDFVKSNRLNLYPYLGLGFRSTSLKYQGTIVANPSPTTPMNSIQNNQYVSDHQIEGAYIGGLGIDVYLSKLTSPGGVIFFIKGETNRAFKEKNFNFPNLSYDADLQPGYLNFHVGFKFGGRGNGGDDRSR